MRGFLRYLGSARNLAGLGLALGGVLLHVAGLLGALWPLVVVALYAAGALVVRGRRPRVPKALTFDAQEVRRAVDHAYQMTHGRMPPDVQATVARLRQEILALLPHAADFPVGSQDLYVLQRTATTYLPATLEAYLALPPAYATTQVLQDGKTPLQAMKDQLELLDARMDEIRDAVYQRDSDRLLAQGRFLEEKFGGRTGGLSMPPAPGDRR